MSALLCPGPRDESDSIDGLCPACLSPSARNKMGQSRVIQSPRQTLSLRFVVEHRHRNAQMFCAGSDARHSCDEVFCDKGFEGSVTVCDTGSERSVRVKPTSFNVITTRRSGPITGSRCASNGRGEST